MTVYIIGEYENAGWYAEAEFNLRFWDEDSLLWIDDTEGMEQIPHDAMITWNRFRDMVDYWQGEIDTGDAGDWDMSGYEWQIDSTDEKNLVFDLRRDLLPWNAEEVL